MYLQQGVKIKLNNIHLNIVFTNLLSDESLAPENICTVLFGKGKLKITMKQHAACAYDIKQLVPVRREL